MDYNLNVKPETVKLEENGGKIIDVDWSWQLFFFNIAPKAQIIKAKINKWNILN